MQSFEVVKAGHLLEHVKTPFEALDEILRISSKTVILSFPTKYDVLPWFVSNIFPIPSLSAFRLPYLTRKNRLPCWVVKPGLPRTCPRIRGSAAYRGTGTVSLF